MQSGERLAALFAAAVAIALNVAASIQLFTPPSTFGYRLVYTDGNRVAGVDPGTPAERAAIRPGDRLDFSRSSLHDRIVGLDYQPPVAGERTSFDISKRSKTLTATPLTAEEARHATASPLTSFLRLTGFAYIVVALLILLRRPNRMTWGLFLYLVSATNVAYFRFPVLVLPIAQLASDILTVAGLVGLVIFAARFPDDKPAGWRVWLDRLAIPIGALFVIPNLAWDATALFGRGSPDAWMSLGSVAGALALIVIAGATLLAAYFAVSRAQRQRFVWVMAGVFFTLLSYASDWARYWSTTYTIATSDALAWIAIVLYAVAPFAIAYAVVRQRVFDISFVISRTLVYTILTGCIFAIFAFVEWLAARFIEQSGVTIVLVALTAIGIAFSLEAAHARIEAFVESILFRRRHLAERHLASVAAGLPFAESGGIVDEALVHEPVEAYALTTSALFKRDDAGDYRRDDEPLDSTVSLRLLGTRHAVRLSDGDAVLAVPVFVRARLEAVALYGPHANGEDIDPDEVASLEAICAAAGTAYDHLDALRITREIARWRRLAERQARELAALRERASLLGEHLAGDDAHGNGPV
ncbi:MAG: hypothetical protein JO190_11335 [Candidatus Eremiobacteraeota bacterium]|nr:hypothetical protein [Candidatus Eremiobacteraeota bacterium]